MALRGNLKDFSLPDVFQLVTFSKKTGVLRITRADSAEGSVWFRDGEVFFAQSNWHGEPLGERLVHASKITPSALAKALDIRSSEGEGGRRLGQVLVEEGYITEKVLESFVQEQIQDTIFDIMRWDEGDFDFELLPEVVDEDIGLSVSMENVIMEGSRRLEEWTRIKKKIPSMEIVFKMATAPGEGTFEISLKPIEWNLLLLVDGTRSVAELARTTNRTDFEVARIMYGLFSAGLLEVASDEEVERLRAERVEQERIVGEIRAAEAADVARAANEAQLREAALAEKAAARMSEAPAAPSEPVAPTEPVADVAPDPAQVVDSAASDEMDEREPEMPEFLAGGSTQASDSDMAVFEEMMGAVLEAPSLGVPELELEPEPESEPEPEPEPQPEPAPDPDIQLPVEDETAPAFEITGDLERDLMALGLGELPSEDLLEPMGAEEAGSDVETPGYEDILSGTADAPPPAPVQDFAELVDLAGSDVAEATEDFGAELDSAAYLGQDDSAEMTIAEIEAAAVAGAEDDDSVSEAAATPDFSDILESLDTDMEPEIVQTESFDDDLSAPAASGVISTDAFLADIGSDDLDVGLTGGLGAELSALTGAGGARRPTASVNRIPEPGSSLEIHRDQTVDKELVMKIIAGIEKL